MRTPLRSLVLGSLLAFGATAAHAQAKAADATAPVAPPAAPPSVPIDLTLHPTSIAPAAPAATLTLTPNIPSTPSAAPPTPAAPTAAAPAAAIPTAAVPNWPVPYASAEVDRVSRWVVESRDNAGLPFLLIDKANAQVLAFNPAGQLQGGAPVLLGMARGDRMLAPNNAPMSAMSPQVRITPAGRFVSRLAKDSHGKELLVLDYAASLSLHPVVKGKPVERRAERLKSETSQDNRISFGCINVPVDFYATIVSPSFTGTRGIVYVLPETSPANEFYGFQLPGAAAAGAQQASAALGASAQPVAAPNVN